MCRGLLPAGGAGAHRRTGKFDEPRRAFENAEMPLYERGGAGGVPCGSGRSPTVDRPIGLPERREDTKNNRTLDTSIYSERRGGGVNLLMTRIPLSFEFSLYRLHNS